MVSLISETETRTGCGVGDLLDVIEAVVRAVWESGGEEAILAALMMVQDRAATSDAPQSRATED